LAVPGQGPIMFAEIAVRQALLAGRGCVTSNTKPER
jgi:hypothetical protein